MHLATQGSTPTPHPEAGNTDRTPSRGRTYRTMRVMARILLAVVRVVFGLFMVFMGLPKLLPTGHDADGLTGYGA